MTRGRPDLDLLYFYGIDGRQHLHHSYWTHIPAYWIGFALLIAGVRLVPRARRLASPLLRYFVPNGLLHLLLDSIAAKVRWLYPLSDAGYGLVSVPASHSPWWLSFVLHWSFLLELAIVAAAGWAFLFDRRRRRPSAR